MRTPPGALAALVHRGTRSRAFTLIEMMAVATILSMVVVVTLGSAAFRLPRQQLEGISNEIEGLDVTARALGRTGETVTMVVSHDRDDRAVHLISSQSDDLTIPIALPRGMSAQLIIEPPDTPLIFDLEGTSPDYRVRLGIEGESLSWHVAGLTGWSYEEEP